MINIYAYLPIGSDSVPVTREQLCRLTGLDDRAVRGEIAKAKREVPIVNVGNGYYIADDPDDPNLKEYILKEMHRIREINRGLRKHKWLYKVNKKQETLNVDM
mgnify:CR=1 FL=1